MDPFVTSVNGISHTEAPQPRDPFAGPLSSIAPGDHIVLACLMFTVTSLSLTENFTVMLVTFRFKQLRQPLNYIIVNLAVADFLVCLIGGTISFLTNASGYFFLGRWACVLEDFAVTLFGIVVLWSLAVLAFERYFVICHALKDVRLDNRHAAMGLLFVWTIPPVFSWSSYTVSKIGTTCEPNWYSTECSDHTYIITFVTTCFILPLGVIIGSYGKLMQKLRRVSNAHGGLGSARKPDSEVGRRVIVTIAAFMVGWTPYAAFSIVVTACPSIHLDPCLAAVPAFFSKTATVYNPIIYVFMNRQFRKCLLQLFKGNSAALESHLNPTSDQAAGTADSKLGEMFTITARVPISGSGAKRPEEEQSEGSSNTSQSGLGSRIYPV
ncbi:vertebrate ancient opsin-like [Brienomyrus brachyistius]|uniref:vertebrate ancient opsin-like n=1 Tax=Brienomyrus brachyistius TaxID=42636 RepID=UPI0020B2232A|nr:vertebrate ancient opsin-like [Brienomyrus brachyistius]